MAWTTILLGEVSAGDRWARVLNGIDVEALPADDQVPFESGRAMVRAAMFEDGYERALEDSAYAIEHEPAASPWRDQALHLWGLTCLLRGEHDAAQTAFEEAVAVATARGNSDTVILSEPELALFAMEAGHAEQARDHAGRGVAMIEERNMEGYPTTALALAVAARVAIQDNDRAEAELLLARGMRARVGCTYLMPCFSIRVRLQLAKAHVALGDRSAAQQLLTEIDEVLRRRPDMGSVTAQVEEFRIALTTDPGQGGAAPLSPAELRVLPYLQTHLTIAEIGERLFVSRNTVSTQVGSIYRKLMVATRAEAVEKAVTLGLLGA